MSARLVRIRSETMPSITHSDDTTTRAAPTSSDCTWPPPCPAAARTAYRTNGASPSSPNSSAITPKIT